MDLASLAARNKAVNKFARNLINVWRRSDKWGTLQKYVYVRGVCRRKHQEVFWASQQKAALDKAKRGEIIVEVDTLETVESLDYAEQGDLDMYTQETQVARDALRRHPAVEETIRAPDKSEPCDSR